MPFGLAGRNVHALTTGWVLLRAWPILLPLLLLGACGGPDIRTSYTPEHPITRADPVTVMVEGDPALAMKGQIENLLLELGFKVVSPEPQTIQAVEDIPGSSCVFRVQHDNELGQIFHLTASMIHRNNRAVVFTWVFRSDSFYKTFDMALLRTAMASHFGTLSEPVQVAATDPSPAAAAEPQQPAADPATAPRLATDLLETLATIRPPRAPDSATMEQLIQLTRLAPDHPRTREALTLWSDRMLLAAEQDVTAMRYSLPEGHSAFDKYQAVQSLDPHNPRVGQGLRELVQRYRTLIDRTDKPQYRRQAEKVRAALELWSPAAAP
ncbi:MAG: hypothetical protein HQL82_14205 [Magnetococcales bacterium]|nr:hypothetical protein [Magnetococcales bacterium]